MKIIESNTQMTSLPYFSREKKPNEKQHPNSTAQAFRIMNAMNRWERTSRRSILY